MKARRTIRNVWKSKPTIEGAGVHLKRVFGFPEVPDLDPFLLLDDFRSHDPDLYLSGFPWHPHRGIETITYMTAGKVEHGDSLGNRGIISSGDVQWMTAGSGIIHQEMPKGDGSDGMGGFQLWANLPASHKMMDPRYREITREEIPEITLTNGAALKVIRGNLEDVEGPVRDVVVDSVYLDVSVPPQTQFTHSVRTEDTVFIYMIEGECSISEADAHDSLDEKRQSKRVDNGTLVLFDSGEYIAISTTDRSARFLLISGTPIGEPVAWRGPIVMNTQQELQQAFAEYREGSFIKH